MGHYWPFMGHYWLLLLRDWAFFALRFTIAALLRIIAHHWCTTRDYCGPITLRTHELLLRIHNLAHESQILQLIILDRTPKPKPKN